MMVCRGRNIAAILSLTLTCGESVSAQKPGDPWYAVHHGFEVQIADGGRPDRGTGSIYTFAKANARPGKPLEWNTLEITLKGDRVFTAINGVPVADFDAGVLKPQATEITGE